MSIPWTRDLDACSVGGAQWLVRAFYAFVLYLAAQALPDLGGLTRVRELQEIWPVWWMEWLPPGQGATIVFFGFLFAALLGVLFPERFAVRLVVALALLEYVALRNSEGRISHSLHLPVLVSFVFLLLPRQWHLAQPGTESARQLALVLRGAQAVMLLTYSMSGLAKLGASLYELAMGQVSSFHPSGFQRVIAGRLLETGSSSPFAQWIIDHPGWLTWPLLPGAIYFQCGAVFAAFRPALHQLWGLLLIVFHLGTGLILTIHFPVSVFLLALFLLGSPFRPTSFDVGRVLTELPLLSAFWRVASRRMFSPNVPASLPGGPGSASH